MKCSRCAAWTSVKETRAANAYMIRRRRECANGHRTNTYEVIEGNLGSMRDGLPAAVKAAEKRAALYARDRKIMSALASGRSGKDVAREFNLAENSISAVKKRMAA